MSARTNVLRLRRGRTVGFGLIVIMGFLLFGFIFLVDEPTKIVIVPDDPATPIDEEIVIELPPIEEIIDLQVPIPTFEPRTLSMTPIVTTTDDLGVSTTIRGETTFLTSLLGLDITLTVVEGQTFNNGFLKIELEFVTDKTTDEAIFLMGELDIFSPATPFVPEGIGVIQVCPPRCGNILISTNPISVTGLTQAGVFVTEIFNDNGYEDNYTVLINWTNGDVKIVHQSIAKTLRTCKQRLAKFKVKLLLTQI